MNSISKEGLDHIKKFEGWRSCVYLDVAGIPTIGYGFTWYPSDGKRVSENDPCISLKKGEEMLRSVLLKFEAGVNNLVIQGLSQCQFDAIVSFAYNVGVHALANSTLLKVINKNPNDFKEIERQFKRWNKSGGKVYKGLIKRRNSEYWLYSQKIRKAAENAEK